MQTAVQPGTGNWVNGILLGIMVLGAMLAIFAVGYDQGWLTSFAFGDLSYQLNIVHETFHDARHSLGLPCH